MKQFIQDYKNAKFQYSWYQSIFHAAWFSLDWWKYLLEKRNLRHFLCRIRGHAGVGFYNCGGDEPDMTCKFCDDDLG